MIETAFAQLRFALSLGFGARFQPRALERILESMLDTRREFGPLDAEAGELVEGPRMNDEARRGLQVARFSTQTRRALETPFYRDVFDRAEIHPGRLGAAEIGRIPRTRKEALRTNPDAFVRVTAQPWLRAFTTGTTGSPTAVHFSRREVETLSALTAIEFLFRRQIEPEDIVQISVNPQAVLAVSTIGGACARIGASAYLAGLVDPRRALSMLTERRGLPGRKSQTSVLVTYASYLGALVEAGNRAGYRPADFGLERIAVGGEILTDGAKAHCARLFGDVEIVETYASTEIIPFGGRVCAEGHLHFQPAVGLLEVLDPETSAPVGPGEVGTIVATPLPPYRETTPLLRYDTEDAVCPIGAPLGCELRDLPATTRILGRLRYSVRHDRGWTFQRHVLEALEEGEDVPLPARYGFWPAQNGVAVEVAARTGADPRRILSRLEERGVPVQELHVVDDPARLTRPIPLRADLGLGALSPAAPSRRLMPAGEVA